MKKLGTLLVGLFVSVSAFADNSNNDVFESIQLAAAETSASASYIAERSEEALDKFDDFDLDAKTESLNDKINAQLEKSFQAKLNRDLNF